MAINEPPRDDQDTPIQVRYYNHISSEWDLMNTPLLDMETEQAIMYVPKGKIERYNAIVATGERPGIAMLTVLAERGSSLY